jgi:hypothetical protein
MEATGRGRVFRKGFALAERLLFLALFMYGEYFLSSFTEPASPGIGTVSMIIRANSRYVGYSNGQCLFGSRLLGRNLLVSVKLKAKCVGVLSLALMDVAVVFPRADRKVRPALHSEYGDWMQQTRHAEHHHRLLHRQGSGQVEQSIANVSS